MLDVFSAQLNNVHYCW